MFMALNSNDFAVFLDWCSMYQALRTTVEHAAFKRSLGTINYWYAHLLTVVWMLTAVPEGCDSKPYHERGWPTFEFGIASMITPFNKLLDIGLIADGHKDY